MFLLRGGSGALLSGEPTVAGVSCTAACGGWLPDRPEVPGILNCEKLHGIRGGGRVVTNLGIGILAGDIARSISEPVLEAIAICGPRISRSLGFLCAGIGDEEIGSGALGRSGATGGGTGLPGVLPAVSHLGKFLPSLIFVTSEDPENSPGEFGGSGSRLIPDVDLSLLGGPAKPRAQQGLIMMHSLQIREKQEVHASVMRVSLHLSQALCSMPDELDGAAEEDDENFDMSSSLRPDVFARSVRLSRLMPPCQTRGVSGLLGGSPVPDGSSTISVLSGSLSGRRMPPGDGAGGSDRRRRSRLWFVSSDRLRGKSLNMRAGHPQKPPGAWFSGCRHVAGIRLLMSGTIWGSSLMAWLMMFRSSS